MTDVYVLDVHVKYVTNTMGFFSKQEQQNPPQRFKQITQNQRPEASMRIQIL